MWKWIGGGVLAVIVVVGGLGFYLSDKIYPRFDHAQVAPAAFGHRYSAAELREDFNHLTATVEHIHPDIAAITDGPAYERAKAQTLARLDRPMTRTEFWRVLAPFTGGNYHDGHTELLPLTEEWAAYEASAGLPPFAVTVQGDAIVISKSTPGSGIPDGAELVAINGVDARAFRTWLVSTELTETQAAAREFAAHGFAERLWAYGVRAPFAVSYRVPGRPTAQVQLNGIGPQAWERAFAVGGDGQGIRVSFDGDVAHLTVKTFEQPWDRYKGWLAKAFDEIQARHARAVVLDLRENTGGDSRQSDELQAYLSDKQLPALAEVDLKATPEVKAMYRTLLPKGFRWIPLNRAIPMLAGIQDAPDNGFYVFHPEAAAPSERSAKKKTVFRGPLYVLISPLTYSQALLAAAPYKHWKRATLIGETTGEPLTFYGDFYAFDLPHSKLQMHVSHKRFVVVGSKGPNQGLEPDIFVTPQDPDAYRIALREIHKRAAAAGAQ